MHLLLFTIIPNPYHHKTQHFNILFLNTGTRGLEVSSEASSESRGGVERRDVAS